MFVLLNTIIRRYKIALIKCPECGKDVSDTIESCIHCGFVLTKEDKEKIHSEVSETKNNSVTTNDITDGKSTDDTKDSSPGCLKFLIATVCIIGCFIFLTSVLGSCINRNVITGNQSSSVTAASVIEISLNTIHSDFLSNKLVAKEKYLGKRYQPKEIAQVYDIDEDYITVTVSTDYPGTVEYFYVKLYYKNSERDFVRNLKKMILLHLKEIF